MIGLASKRRFGVLVALAAAMLAGGPAFAQSHGGGGHGGGGGGGGGHFAGGGGHSFAGGGRSFGGGAPHFSGGGGARFGGGGGFAPHISAAPHVPGAPGAHYASGFASRSGAHVGYAPRPGFSSHASVGTHVASATHGYVGGRAGYGRPGYAQSGYGRPGSAYGRPGWYRGGYHGYNWGGGYWHGAFWPRAYYGWGFPLFLPVLPAIYATYYWGGIPYYYANDVYYTWNAGQNGYAATDPPPVAGTASSDDSNGQAGNAQDNGTDVYAYPQNGQTDEQQSNDRYECHTWARSQTGFDPTVSSSTGNADDYRRAMIACMNARGYSSQ